MPELEKATQDIDRALREFEVGRARELGFRRQLAATDHLLDLLEQMNLREAEFLGAAAARQVARTLETLPPPLRPAMAPGTSVQRALDMVFEVQEALFSWRVRQRQGPWPEERPSLAGG
ncbi:MAG TPA: hypothetical protein VFD49_09975 [Candidatus Dormibacteraeota bacterium]|nr:hypothetical protein [Candidatus Dormibacteraeota bacterium]